MKNNPISLINEKGDVTLFDDFLDSSVADMFFTNLMQEIDWQQYPIQLFGKTYMQPRLIGWYGDVGIRYKYSKRVYITKEWTPSLIELRALLFKFCGVSFNSVLLNLYRDGQDSMGWHSDNEPELGAAPLIASVSLGSKRRFQLRLKADKKQKVKAELVDGSLLLMQGDTQQYWEHQVPKQARVNHPRINLTFRTILPKQL